MLKLGLYSFRRILLSRLLLLSVPVLLIGVAVTYHKARTALLETARRNLTESAVTKGESIDQSIKALRSNLVSASNSIVLQAGSHQEHQSFLSKLAQQLPTTIECIQLVDLQTQEIVAGTCRHQTLYHVDDFQEQDWLSENSKLVLDSSQLIDSSLVYVKQLLPDDSLFEASKTYEEPKNNTAQLKLILGAPVYDLGGQLRYALCLKTALVKQEITKPGSLSGYPVIIDEDETILVHPLPERVGSKIGQQADAERLRKIITDAIAGKNDARHLFALENNGVELVAGYSSIPSPITSQPNSQWIILAVTREDHALIDLKSIRRALLGMTFALILASFLATLYISRELARPLEKMRDYALNEDNVHTRGKLPQNLSIREFNQLAIALNNMVERLKAWAEELETAWKEGQVANQLKNEFLATISHELRTPLNGIIGFIQLVRDGYCDDKEEEQELLQQAHDASIHLLSIINDILDIAKIEQGKLSICIEQVDLCQILHEVISLQTVPIQEKGLTLITDPCSEGIFVHADSLKLKQVLLNVVGNAVKFTDAGAVKISTHLEPLTTTAETTQHSDNSNEIIILPSFDRQQVVITVEDSGIGIDPAQQEKLFRPFVMADGSTTRKFGGTGLGLAISRNLMQLMGGNISLYSPGEGQGTTVKISIRVAKVVALWAS